MYPVTFEKLELLGGELTLRGIRDPSQYVSTVMTVADLEGFAVPDSVRQQVRHLNRGLQRDRGPAESMRPLTIEMFRSMRGTISNPAQGRAWLTYVMSFFFLLRSGEAYLLRKDEVEFFDEHGESVTHDTGVLHVAQVALRIRKSKTDTRAHGVVRRIRCTCTLLGEDPQRGDGLPLCPVHACQKLASIAGSFTVRPWERVQIGSIFDARKPIVHVPAEVEVDPPFLRRPDGSAILCREVTDNFFDMLACAGIANTEAGREKHLYASHSCRRGGAQLMARGGHPISEISAWGRWSSDCVQRYVEEAQFESALIGLRLPLVASTG